METARAELLAGGEQRLTEMRQLLSAPASEKWEQDAVQLRVLEILQELGPAAQSAGPEVAALVADGMPHVASVAAQTLPAIGAPAGLAVPVITRSIQREPTVVPLRALAEYHEEAGETVSLLMEIMNRHDLDVETRWNAVRTIGKMREAGVPAIDALGALLNDKEPTVREHAAEALGDIGPTASRAAVALIAALDDEYVKVRRDAVRSLGQIDPDRTIAVPAIEKMLEDPEQIVQDAARQALERLNAPAPSVE
ncbi:MAG: HEAT repeat domain-containing protein [Pirellulaceae bacterium]